MWGARSKGMSGEDCDELDDIVGVCFWGLSEAIMEDGRVGI
jgi:hypothetical protein